MVRLGRTRLLPAALVALILVSATRAQDDTVNFGFYPGDSQDCLYQAATSSKCKSSTVEATNSCFCRNGGDFITTAAACIGQSSPNVLKMVYQTMRDACAATSTPIGITEDEFMEAANGATTTTSSKRESSETTSDSATTTATVTGTVTTTGPAKTVSQDDEQQGQGSTGGSSALTTGALAGIVAGAIGGLAVLGGVIYFLFRRRGKAGEESHPMLPQHTQGHLSTAPAATESTAYYGSPPDTGGWPKKDWGTSPDLRNSGFNWESPAHLSMTFTGGALAPSPPPPVQELDGAQLHPPGSTLAPVEMGGSPVVTTAQPASVQYQAYNPGQQQHPGPGWSQTSR
ncbi:hypothetical protein N657DRAFT_569542 [Parathielavia appendiculata]|uniref:Extracellular membrane protein CFEM domain-containing protein n=1 Tax=Parathielavia appendiculata TaxID=2587402 RepID=A0AAN6Z5Q6_9PEZI|nr:hypothetical protein N657DRAFT_569542 [Parathielavia appendiculata]